MSKNNMVCAMGRFDGAAGPTTLDIAKRSAIYAITVVRQIHFFVRGIH